MSDDVDAVIELLERWRDASGMGRMRIGLDATRTIAQLPAARKRALAIEVAERVAPELVPAIRAESGDLTTQQVGAVVDLLRRADQEQLDELVKTLRSGDVVGTLDLVDEAVSAVAPPDEETDELLADIAEPDEPVEPEPAASADAAEGASGTPAAAAAAAAARAAATDDEEVAIAEDGSLELDEEAVRERLEEEAAARAAQYRDSSRDVPTTPAYRAPDVDFIGGDTDLDLPDPTVEPVAPLHERLGRSPGSAASDAGPAARGDGSRPELRAAPVSAQVAALTATPDGYRRRRAALTALRADRLEADDVVAVVRSFERATDRSWVAGAALDARVIGPGDLEDLDLPPTAVARLRRRTR